MLMTYAVDCESRGLTFQKDFEYDHIIVPKTRLKVHKTNENLKS